jgi:signal recognition particle GTPase
LGFEHAEDSMTDRIRSLKKGLYANIHAKRRRIANGSGEKMRQPGDPGAPSAKDFANSKKTAKK